MSVGFTTVKPFVSLGAVYVIGYNESGNAVVYSISVTSRSDSPDVPPISIRHVWQRSWSPGWTCFAFFTLGGENFFLKTNIVFPNVNIDHICDDPSDGSVAVATRMNLEGAQDLKVCKTFTVTGYPHFVAYSNNGEATLYRIHGDCKDFTCVGSCNTVSESRLIIPIMPSKSTRLLFY